MADDASFKTGYLLPAAGDVLDACRLGEGLETGIVGCDIVFLDSIDSTNTYARTLVQNGCKNGTVIVAGNQTAGRGRLGRSWSSSSGKSISMSVVLRPGMKAFDIQAVTIVAAVAVVRALRSCPGVSAGIKWPNDLYLDGRKLCGILTELNSEADRIHSIIIGIGMNVNQVSEDFPEDLKSTAISLRMHLLAHGSGEDGAGHECAVLCRSEIIRRILVKLDAMVGCFETWDLADVVECFKKCSITLGKRVSFFHQGEACSGVAKDITRDGRLVVECDDGQSREIFSGEVILKTI